MKEKIDKDFELLNKLIDQAIKYPELTPDRIIIISGTKESIERILTPARMEIIRLLKRKYIKSVTELCRKLDRPIESVSRDLKILHNYGFLEFIKIGKEKVPKIEKDAILIPLSA